MITPTTTLRMIWSGILLTPIIFYIIVLNHTPEANSISEENLKMLEIALTALGVTLGLLAIPINKMLNGKSFYTGKIGRALVGTEGEDLIQMPLSRFIQLRMFAMGLSNVVALFGFVTGLVGGNPTITLSMCILSMIVTLLIFPRIDEDITLVGNLNG